MAEQERRRPEELGGDAAEPRRTAAARPASFEGRLRRPPQDDGGNHEALLALGGNVGDARATLDRAVALMCAASDVTLLDRSSDYRTPPWGVTDQAPFINLCIAVATTLSPQALLARAHAVERALGRDRGQEQRWGPRTVDIDILAYDDLVIADPALTLPHPRLLERAFVLVPLAEIAPSRIIAGRRVDAALADLDTAGIERLSPR